MKGKSCKIKKITNKKMEEKNMVNYEYVNLREFAKRRCVSTHTARQMAHSKALREFVRRDGDRGLIYVNWTKYQEHFEKCFI